MPPPPSPVRSARPFLAAWLLLAAGLVSTGCGSQHRRTHPLTSLSPQDLDMLREYESVRAALAQDDVRQAKRTAASFQRENATATAGVASPVPTAVAKIAAVNGLEPQRDAFRTWSAYVIPLTREVEGFYVIHCPVPGCGDWLQTSPKVDNPYMGMSMHDCGEVQQ